MRPLNTIAVATMMLMFFVGTARAQAPLPRPEAKRAISSAPYLATANRPLVASALTVLPPEEKPKTHWPWWLRILAVVGVLVFIRLVAGSVRNKPGTPGPNGS